MATLNTLRTKGGVVLAVVISVSLLAFLLGDFTQSGGTLLNSSRMNVGTIDGVDIPAQEYSVEVDQVLLVQQMLSGSESLTEQQMTAVRNQAWERVIREVAIMPTLKELGLMVSEDEMVDMAAGENVSPVLQSIFVNPQTGMFDRDMLRSFAANLDLDATGSSATLWSYLEDEMVDERIFSKYFSLITNAIVITSSEVEQIAEYSNSNSNISFVTKPTFSVADSLIKVTESDLRKYYKEHQNEFKTVATRNVDYIVFDALPSAKDYEDAKAYINTLAEEFLATTEVEQFVNLNSNSNFNSQYFKSSEFPTQMRDFVAAGDTETMYGPVMSADVYTMARIIDSKQLPDTLGAKHILMDPANAALTDSIVTVLKKDKSKFAQLASEFSYDQNANLSGGDLGRFAMNQMIPQFANAVAAAKKGDIITVETPYGLHIVEVTEIGPRSEKYQVAIVDYTVNPSSQTEQIAYAKASEFASKASASGADFDNLVSESGASKRVARLQAGDRNIQGVDGSVEIVRWAFNNKKGAVSDVISIGEANYVARVTDVKEHGIAPIESVVAEVRTAVISEKKSDYLVNMMGGASTLEQVSSQAGVEISDYEGVNFKMFYIPEIGMASKVVGAVSVMSQGQISKPLVSLGNVTVARVDSKVAAENTSIADEKAILEATALESIQQRVMGSIMSEQSIVDNRIKFF